MNYAGKFDAALSLDGQGPLSPAGVHVDSFTAKAHGHVPEGAFVVPDPNLIFYGEFKRAGGDLVLSHDGREFVVHNYFNGDKRAAIASPDGAHLTGDIVSALTGHVQVAQAAPGVAAAQVIGHVTKLAGSATAIRNGVSIILNNGDNVEKGDVVSTGADSTLGITFIDGTVFGLSSNARMVLNEMVYDPNGSNNSSLLSLVAGTITFVAGETAKHGDMKVDTPVATMGIRGTAVVAEITFTLPPGALEPQPQASFWVAVEPDGHTGSYILFDKTTLLPIATVNQAGQMVQISGGNVSVTNALLSPDVQKLITDVFTLKFTDNGTNTKLTTNFTDTITPTPDGLMITTPSGATATVTVVNLNLQGSQGTGPTTPGGDRIPGPPNARSLDLNNNVKTAFALTERADTTGDTTHSDTISGRITFLDQNLGDRPTVSISLADAPNYVYKNAGQQDVTSTLTALQKLDIAATQIAIQVVADGGNSNSGSAVWTYTIPDNVFDFLAAGETLTLTYMVRVNDNFAVNPESTYIPITITITGTNDKPVITSSVPTIVFEGGTSVPGGPLTSDEPTSGTLSFKDVDLTDTHSVSVKLTSATLPGGTVPPGPLAAFASAMSVSIAAGADSTGSGAGTINWSLADLPVYLADFIPKGEVLTLVYTVTVTDSQGATSDQTITVTITGTDAPAVVWIATNGTGGFWKDAVNWETGTVPTIDDDVIVITDQLHGLTPSYPVTIDAAAYAKSVTMNDFGGPPPQLINKSSLTIAGALNMSADSILTNTVTGTITVGGKAEILGTSVLTNAGHLTLAGGGDFAAGTSITNSGTIELSGGTLTTLADIHNAGGTLAADAGTTLVVDNATIDGGTVSIGGTLELDGTSLIENGLLANSGAVDIKGTAELAGETVSNSAAGTIKVLANGALTIDQGSLVTNAGNVTVDASGKLTVNNATIGGAGTITDNGEIDLTGSAVLSGGALKNNAAFKVSGSGNALHDEAVTNAGTIEVLAGGALAIDQGSTIGNAGGNVIVDDTAALTLNDATISGGAVKGAGTIDVTGNSTIDGHATLNLAAVTVESGVTLTLDDATVAGTAIANGGTVKIDAAKKLTMNGASLTGGALAVTGTLDSTGTSTVTNASITNNGLLEALGGLLTLAATSSATIANAGTLQANGGELDINGEAVTNTGTLAAINDSTLKLISTTVTNSGLSAAVSVEAGSTLDLSDAILDGGKVTISGTLESTGTSAINNGDITNTGTITVTSGTLTIDPAIIHTVTNQGLLEANGGELDISGDLIVNTADIKAIQGGILKLTSLTVTNVGGTVTVDGTSKLYLSNVEIDGGSLSNSGSLYGAGSNTVSAAVTNTGTIEVQSGTLNLSGGLTGAGALVIDDGATLELAGATAQTVTFNGGVDTLQLDNVAGQSFTGTIAGVASTGGTFTVTGAADITTSTGDALDFTASGGTQAKPADIVLTPTGALKGAANGVVVTQNGVGDITLTATKDITGLAGNGITLRDSATGVGDITVTNLTGKATGTGANSVGLLVENLNGGDIAITQLGGAVGGAYGMDATTKGDGDITIDAGGTVEGSTIYGIRARSYGSGSETVTTEAGSVITSGSSGIVAVNRATSIDASENSTITVNAYGTINSGSSLNQSGNAPAGIQTGYTGAATGSNANTDVNGTVVVNNHANITAAAGYGIHAYNYGNGDVIVKDGAGTIVVGAQDGIRAQALSGGSGDISVTLGTNASVTGTTGYAVIAYSTDQGDISVTMSGGDSITSGSSGIVAVNYATAIADGVDSTITVEAHGTIHSGTNLNNDGTTPGAIIAGYKPNGTSAFSSAVNGDVIVTSDATITAAAGYGIEAFTWGAGDITVTTGKDSSITAAGTAIGAFDHGGGDVSVTNQGWAAGAVALGVLATGAGDVTIVNDGVLTATGTAGIIVTQNGIGGSSGPAATGSTHITNTGSVVGASGHYAIFVQENTTGTATIDNSGTIGPDDPGSVTATTFAIAESGGHITINNSGDINGTISVATATFNNEAGGTWTVAGSSVFGSLSSIDNHGVIDLLNGASISGSGLSIANSGEIDSWGTTSISGTISNTGTIEVDSGTLALFGSLSGSGSVAIDAGATLEVNATVSQTVSFAGAGAELQIDTSSFGGSIAGLAATDKIDLSSIEYGLGTSAVYVSNAGHTGGVLTVTDADGHSISLTLVGDYCSASFAGSDDGTGHTLITLNAADDAPQFNPAETSQSLSFTELAGATGSSALDPASGGTGTIHFTDIDLTDLPAATITGQLVTGLDADHATPLTLTAGEISALEQALSLQQTGQNNGAVTWTYSIADGALDFLGAGQTVKVVSTITLDDGHGKTDTAAVTVTITGTNDAPTLDNATLGAVSGGDQDPAGTSVADLFAGKFHDADAGASLKAVAVSADNATADQGVWQYEIAGTDQWVDISGVSDSNALVLSPDTLIRFVPAQGFSGTPGTLDVHALDDTYAGAVTTDTQAVVDITSAGIGHGGSAPASDLAAAIGVDVTDPLVINTENFQVWHSYESNTDLITNLSVTDTASGASTDTFTVTAVTAHAPESSVDPASASGSLADLNLAFENGVTYDPGETPPDTDEITLTVTDTTTGSSDTVHFIFNEAGDTSQGITLQGTGGKDVIFATDTNDTLTGGGGKDQFVFAPGMLYGENGQPVTDFSHTITDFTEGLDKIDLRQFSDVSSISNLTIVQQAGSGDTLVTWQQQVTQGEGASITETEQLLLKDVIAANLKASDFIFHVT